MNLEYVKKLQQEIHNLNAEQFLLLEERRQIISYLDSLGSIPADKFIVGSLEFIKFRIEELQVNR